MEIVIILDESGSMESMGTEPLQAVDEFIKQRQQENQETVCYLSFYTFNAITTKHRTNVNLQDIHDVKEVLEYAPKGMTALYDCVYEVIKERKDQEAVILVIVTDGNDNCSKISKSKIQTEIKTMETEKKWKIHYIGTNTEMDEVMNVLNIPRSSSVEYDRTPGSLNRAMSSVASNITRSIKFEDKKRF